MQHIYIEEVSRNHNLTTSRRSCVPMTSSLAMAMAMMLAPATAHAETDTDTNENEIVVTAQKREQNLIDVPMSITAINGAQLQERGITDIRDLTFAVPGLTISEVGGPGNVAIFLRGLANQSGTGALVSLYLNEAPLTIIYGDQLSPDMLDLQRVEVLKGPQGTLYGQGSAGGTIRFIANRPDLTEVTGSVGAEAFTVNTGNGGYELTGVINLPLVEDKLGLRVAASFGDGGGWIDQPEAGITNGNGTEKLSLRAMLRWSPDESFDADAMVQIHRADTFLGLGYEEPDRTVDVGIDRSKVLIPKEFDFTLYNLELNKKLGFAILTSSTSYIDFDHRYSYNYIPRPGNFSYGYVEGYDDLRDTAAWQFSQELRLSSSDGPLKWTLGGFYTKSKRYFIENYVYIYDPEGDLYTSNNAGVYSGFFAEGGTSETISAFADVSYDIATGLTLGGGLRYFHDKESYFSEYVAGTGVPQEANFQSVDPRVYLNYKFAADKAIYASFAKGFRSGGFNSEPFGPYRPEKAYTWELGTRGELANGAINYDVAAYFTKYDDLVRRRAVLVGGFFLQERSNVGKVEVKGIEVGLSARPIPPLTLSITAAYIDSEIKQTDPGDVVNLPGDRVDYTPKFTIVASARYAFDLGPDMPAFVRVDYSHRDELTFIDRSGFATSALPQRSDAIDLVGARFGVELGRANLEFYVDNLFDVNRAIDPYVGWANSNRTRPRVFGTKIGFNF